MSAVAETVLPTDIVDRKYCGYHNGFARADSGKFVIRGKVTVWMCERCADLRKGNLKLAKEK